MLLKLYLIFIVYMISFVVAQRTPTISYISQEQIKDIGGTVELECSVQYAQEYPVLWMKVDRGRITQPLPISTGSSLIIPDGRFSLRYDTASSTYTLQIKDIQETDAGYYQCQVIIALNNKITAEVDLQVRRPPVISDNSTRSAIVSEGQQVTLECYANGYPPPRISWRRENNAILPTGGSIYRGHILKITAIRKEDRGTYYCVAENGVGKGSRRNIAVEVEFSPVISVPRPRLGQALQYDMDLVCHVEAYPPPALSWIKDDVQLSNNQHYSISHFATADEFTDTTLRVITIEKRQYGNYSCKAANKLGTAQQWVELFDLEESEDEPDEVFKPSAGMSTEPVNSAEFFTPETVTSSRSVTPKPISEKTTSSKVETFAEAFHNKKMEYLKEEHDLKMKAIGLEVKYWEQMNVNALAPFISQTGTQHSEQLTTTEQETFTMLSDSINSD